MLFPVSGIEVNPIVPFGVAFFVSFFTSMGGVSGAFMLLPFQVSILGYTAPSVSGTNQVFNIVAIPSGVYRYIREKRMLWPLTWAVIIGTLPGKAKLGWEVVVFDDNMVNAFALPGGQVAIFRGLIEAANSRGDGQILHSHTVWANRAALLLIIHAQLIVTQLVGQDTGAA